ncbi:MAG: DUF429 domain-containing protein [Bdellovibrionales bacterium]
MSRKRIPSSRRPSSRRVKRSTRSKVHIPPWATGAEIGGWPAKSATAGLKVHHFAGISLAGGKTDKTCLAMVEYYPAQNKIFLSRLFERIKSEDEISADLKLHGLLAQAPGKLEMVAFDVPLQLPKCITCKLVCPGFESCSEPEVQWMAKHYRKLNEKRKPKRTFTPYTERCVEAYLTSELEEPFHLSHALGANMAPLTARAHYVSRRLKTPTIEVYPKLSVWRVGRALQISRSHLMFHKHAIGGDESRRIILSRLVDENLAFLYEQDTRSMVENNYAFEAFIAAFTAVLSFRGECEPRPRDFPKSESWIAIPREDIKL